MAKNAALDYVRNNLRRRTLIEEASDMFVPEPEMSPETYAVLHDEVSIIERALAELPERTREMLRLSRLGDLTHAEIAEHFGVSRSLTEKTIAHALIHCRKRMAEMKRREALREAAIDDRNRAQSNGGARSDQKR